MAELLLLAVDRPGHMVGDIIYAAPDGTQWGRLECLPDFVVIRISGTDLRLFGTAQNLLAGVDTSGFSYAEEAMAVAQNLVAPLTRDAVDANMLPTQEVVWERRYYIQYDPDTDSDLYNLLGQVDWYVPTIPAARILDKANLP